MNITRKHLRVTFKGISPLIMHSCKCVNPLHPISLEMKKYTSKRKKTEEGRTAHNRVYDRAVSLNAAMKGASVELKTLGQRKHPFAIQNQH